jgi:hypothetical protein
VLLCRYLIELLLAAPPHAAVSPAIAVRVWARLLRLASPSVALAHGQALGALATGATALPLSVLAPVRQLIGYASERLDSATNHQV